MKFYVPCRHYVGKCTLKVVDMMCVDIWDHRGDLERGVWR